MVNLDHNKPFYKVEFFEPESSSPKLVFSPNIFLDNERPNEDDAVSSEIYISNIMVNSKLEGAVNTAELEIRHQIGGLVNLDLNHKVKIYFGFYDKDRSIAPDFAIVFIGNVTQIKNSLEKTTIFCKSSMATIAGKKSEITFSRMMGVNELIEQLAIQIGGLELAQNGIYDPGINKQAGYGITKTEPLIDYINILSRYGGMYSFMNVNDKYNALPWDPSSLQTIADDEHMWLSSRGKDEAENSDYYKHKIIFDQNLMDVSFELTENKFSGIEVVCLKPFSDDPEMSIDPVNVTYTYSGDSESDKPLKRYKLSHVTREDAEKIAENLYWHDSGKIYGNLKLLGSPQIRVHDGLYFEGEIFNQRPFHNLTIDDGTGEKELPEVVFHVSEVQHRFDTVAGYITNVKLMVSHIPANMTAGGAGEGEEGVEEEGAEDQEIEVEEGEDAEAIRTLVVISRTKRGEIIANAPFILTTPDGEERQEETDENGRFELENAEPGTYLVRFLTAEDLEEEEEDEGGGGLLDTAADALGGFL